MTTNTDPAAQLISAIADDGSLYPIDKLDAHVRDIHHVAISVFVFNQGRLLLQQRACHKYHSGGLWANTCCSHPVPGESPAVCADRRLFEELGMATGLQPFGSIRYRAPVGKLFENETAHCFYGHWPDETKLPEFNTDEVQQTRWMSRSEIMNDVQTNADLYSPWFKIYMTQHAYQFEKIQF